MLKLYYVLCKPVFVFVRTASSVFAVVIVRTRIALTAQPWRFFAKFSLVVGQNETVICARTQSMTHDTQM